MELNQDLVREARGKIRMFKKGRAEKEKKKSSQIPLVNKNSNYLRIVT